MECEECGLYREQARLAQARASEAIAEAAHYRNLWQAASSCIAINASKIKPRGEDEQKLIEIAKKADHGVFWSGQTKGWLS